MNHPERSEYPEHRIRQILGKTRDYWDQPNQRDAVRSNFSKVCACRTPALGGEIYASSAEEKIFYHTCKSRCCPSCGNRGTRLWQREQSLTLPDIPFVGIVLTMPNKFWPLFHADRRLQHDLPAVAAAVLKNWAWSRYRVRLLILVVQHTFGGRLNYNPHLHIMVSAGGLNPIDARWLESLEFDRGQIMELWRFAITRYLLNIHRSGLLRVSAFPEGFDDLVLAQAQRRWNVHITKRMSKRRFLGYAGRYIRRLPITQKRIIEVGTEEVVFQSKDTWRSKIAGAKVLIETRCAPEVFVAMLSDHILDHYKHSMRYFGLLAPRSKGTALPVIFHLLGQQERHRPHRLSWRRSLIQDFGVDPLLDCHGDVLHWVRSLRPLTN